MLRKIKLYGELAKVVGQKVFEAQETILQTNNLEKEDFKFFRFFHFLIQMMWSKKWYYYLLIYLKKHYEIHPIDFIISITKEIEFDKGKIRNDYEFLIQNLRIQNNLIESALNNDVKKFIFIGTSSMYPRNCPQPLKEEYLFLVLERLS